VLDSLSSSGSRDGTGQQQLVAVTQQQQLVSAAVGHDRAVATTSRCSLPWKFTNQQQQQHTMQPS
jgi:hypothetical protein